jgi:hypothetical protein
VISHDTYTLENCIRSHPILSKIAECHIYAEITCTTTHIECLNTHNFTQILNKPGRPLYPQLDNLLEGLWELSAGYRWIFVAYAPRVDEDDTQGKDRFVLGQLPETFHQALCPFYVLRRVRFIHKVLSERLQEP